MSLSEAAQVIGEFLRKDAKTEEGNNKPMTRREIEALTRLLTDATITLEQLSRAVTRRGRGGT